MPSLVVEQKNQYASDIGRVAKQLKQSNGACGLSNMLRGVNVVYGELNNLSPRVRTYVEENVSLCQPDKIHICDGSDTENKQLLQLLQQQGTIVPLPKYDNCWLARTNPADTARVESKTFISTPRREDTIPTPAPGTKGTLGNWMSPEDLTRSVRDRFTGCMRGRTMYVVPYSMGPLGSPLSKLGIELTDSAYVVASMRVMTRMGQGALDRLANNNEFVRCLHAVGRPASGVVEVASWPCDPERTIIMHRPETNDIYSYGSGYGGNSLLGKKCFALRIGSTIARDEGWLAEHMLILGITNPAGIKKYIVAAFPSACGKTNLAMLNPTLPGYKVECVGDDIAWMRFDSTGTLRAINPENGFFGVAPGTSMTSNPNAMKTIFRDTIFTNVAETSDGGVFWEGMEDEVDFDKVKLKDWLGNDWKKGGGKPAAHPNSRFCSPASQCPIIDPAWESPEGVPISAILFGGRRPKGIPLIYEARNWQHGVFIGATMRSEATAAAEHTGKAIMHDPFAMRPFFGYNFGRYLSHWLSLADGRPVDKLPKIYHVNWFRKSTETGKFLWPGFGENSRVLEWVLKRVSGEIGGVETVVGVVPDRDGLNLDGLKEQVDYNELFGLSKDFWMDETCAIEKYFKEQVGSDLPAEIGNELKNLKNRVNTM